MCVFYVFFYINEHIIIVLLTPEHILDSFIETAWLSFIYHLGVQGFSPWCNIIYLNPTGVSTDKSQFPECSAAPLFSKSVYIQWVLIPCPVSHLACYLNSKCLKSAGRAQSLRDSVYHPRLPKVGSVPSGVGIPSCT